MIKKMSFLNQIWTWINVTDVNFYYERTLSV